MVNRRGPSARAQRPVWNLGEQSGTNRKQRAASVLSTVLWTRSVRLAHASNCPLRRDPHRRRSRRIARHRWHRWHRRAIL